ncbi:hypothetical protein KVG29_08700 [Caldicoprobacter algeriensis]|uniref:hypothetical protein n=1 Tax=Caldicoprobacter algeriensis TaxID=699281 RepID=UPI00207A9381|nr:hypothetical protein [Caldicoprobacter algeriensis]MCM8901297.1 hypothetical protein [Caldicoprobacter algeriensis]
MKMKVRIEEVQKGDFINGKKVVEVLHRFDLVVHKWYVRLILEGGRDIVDGYFGTKIIEIERP